jgi:hypothetical protein
LSWPTCDADPDPVQEKMSLLAVRSTPEEWDSPPKSYREKLLRVNYWSCLKWARSGYRLQACVKSELAYCGRIRESAVMCYIVNSPERKLCATCSALSRDFGGYADATCSCDHQLVLPSKPLDLLQVKLNLKVC